jgi:hypothetical protein
VSFAMICLASLRVSRPGGAALVAADVVFFVGAYG